MLAIRSPWRYLAVPRRTAAWAGSGAAAGSPGPTPAAGSVAVGSPAAGACSACGAQQQARPTALARAATTTRAATFWPAVDKKGVIPFLAEVRAEAPGARPPTARAPAAAS